MVAPFCTFLPLFGVSGKGSAAKDVRLQNCGLVPHAKAPGVIAPFQRCNHPSIFSLDFESSNNNTFIDQKENPLRVVRKMPKNWSNHADEIRRLYLKEGKPLKEVRAIMAADHEFEAS